MYIEITNFTNCKKYIRTFLHFLRYLVRSLKEDSI